jgi:hypothetical protein
MRISQDRIFGVFGSRPKSSVIRRPLTEHPVLIVEGNREQRGSDSLHIAAGLPQNEPHDVKVRFFRPALTLKQKKKK